MARTYTKRDLAAMIAAEQTIPQRQALDILDSLFQVMEIALLDPEARIELRGVGVLRTRTHKARDNFNPQTGETVKTPSRDYVSFKPSKLLNERIRAARSLGPRSAPPPPAPPMPHIG